MARIEKTVFISYRRKDISWALAVYQYLTSQKYDVFFDYTSIPSGDFEQIIVSNIRARAHFVLILTPISLDRCSNPGDWLRREIETAIDEKRNIIPLFFDGFSFGSTSVIEKLTGKLSSLNRYNGLDIPSGYFLEAMERLRSRYLNVPLDAVLHPVPTEVKKIVDEQHAAADKALEQKKEVIEELVKPAEEKVKTIQAVDWRKITSKLNPRLIGGIVGGLLLIFFVIWEVISTGNGPPAVVVPEPTKTASSSPLFTQSAPLHTSTAVLPAGDQDIPTDTSSIAPTTAPTLGSGSALVSPKDGMTLLYVPAGEFMMGSIMGLNDEKPVHTVHLDSFWIDRTEVTNKIYAMCVGDGKCEPPKRTSSYSHSVYYGNPEYDDFPVIYVSWKDAVAYCSWAGRRLPTEAEWEKAARGEDAFTYPWGNNAPDNTMVAYNGFLGDPTIVGGYPSSSSPYGAMDMAGNVLEWVNDWYDSNYYSNSPSSNPSGPVSGEYRVLRGGAWNNDAYYIRSTVRDKNEPLYTNNLQGFRCAMDAE